MRKSRQERMKYNQGSIVTKKTIGDLDISLSASGSDEYNSVSSKASYNKGPFTFTHQSTTDRFKDKYNSGKVNYKNSSLGVDTSAGRFGVDKQGSVSYSTTTKRGTKISATANKRGGTLSIFKELP